MLPQRVLEKRDGRRERSARTHKAIVAALIDLIEEGNLGPTASQNRAARERRGALDSPALPFTRGLVRGRGGGAREARRADEDLRRRAASARRARDRVRGSPRARARVLLARAPGGVGARHVAAHGLDRDQPRDRRSVASQASRGRAGLRARDRAPPRSAKCRMPRRPDRRRRREFARGIRGRIRHAPSSNARRLSRTAARASCSLRRRRRAGRYGPCGPRGCARSARRRPDRAMPAPCPPAARRPGRCRRAGLRTRPCARLAILDHGNIHYNA